MKNKPITLEERKKIQLEMLKEIDSFCRSNNIRYSLAFGTLLGAIRHKGFIPWDDDVDIMMPLPDMLKFKEKFHSEVLKYCDVDTETDYEFSFSRIANTNTINKIGIIVETYGICIDVYPLISVPSEHDKREEFFNNANKIGKRRKSLVKWRSRIITRFPIRNIPGFHKSVKKYRDFMFNTEPYGSTGMYYIIAGPLRLRNKMTYDFDMFENIIEVEFEGYKFLATAHYDKYMKLRYGDYMQLPPENQRHPYHGGNYYWK